MINLSKNKMENILFTKIKCFLLTIIKINIKVKMK